MAEFRLTFSTYVVASTLSVLALLLRTWYVHEELYTVVAVLTTQKVALAILYNFVFMLFIGLGKAVLHVLLGQLRDLEVEQVLDSGRGFLLDTVLFLVLSSPTLDGADVSTYALAKFLLLVVALKTAHLVVQIRGATMFEVGHPRAPALVRVCVVLSALLSMDVFAVHFFFIHASRQSTFYLWLLFECLGMLASCGICIMKFGVHLVDLRLDNGWTSKSAVIFYLELMHDVTSLVIFLLFMAVFFITQPSRLPLYMTADIIHVVKALYKRILSLKKYRSLTRNLETRFPDATPEELEAADTCIICRDFLFDGSKKLPCSHIFHIDCLRSWLVQQQSCPTCRADIPTDDTAASAADASGDGSGFSAGNSRAPAQQQQRNGDSAGRVQQHQQHGGAGTAASTGSSAARDSAANAAPAVAGREDRHQSVEGHDRMSAATASAAGAPSACVESVAEQSMRGATADVVGYVQNSAQRLNKAHIDRASDPLGLLDTRIRRSSGRLETAAAAALAAAASAAAVAPSLRASAPTSRTGVDYAEELEAALRLRATQAEAVITGALTQALAMTYQMCDLYRLHASLWTIEAQRAQLEACQTLLQSSELQRSPAVVTRADVSAADGIRRVHNTNVGAADTANPAAAAPPPAETLTPRAGAPTASDDVFVRHITEAGRHRQAELTTATTEDTSGKDAALEGKDKKSSFTRHSTNVEDAIHDTSLQTTNSNDTDGGVPRSKENVILLEQAALSAAAGRQTGTRTAREDAEAAGGDLKRADGGRASATEMKQDSRREYVVVCPSHLFHQAVIPYFSAYHERSVVPFAHGADGRPVDNGVHVTSCAGGSHAAFGGVQSNGAGISGNSGRSLASAATSSASSVRLPDVSETYGNPAAVGQYSFTGPWSATPPVWQGLRGTPCSVVWPPSVSGCPSASVLPPGLREATAAQQRVERATNSPHFAAVQQCMHETSAHEGTGARGISAKEEQVHYHLGDSQHTVLRTGALMQAGSGGMKEELVGSSSAGAETFEDVTSAMVVELERLRKEQHRRWKQGGATNSNSSGV